MVSDKCQYLFEQRLLLIFSQGSPWSCGPCCYLLLLLRWAVVPEGRHTNSVTNSAIILYLKSTSNKNCLFWKRTKLHHSMHTFGYDKVLHWHGMNNIIWAYFMASAILVNLWRACLKTVSVLPLQLLVHRAASSGIQMPASLWQMSCLSWWGRNTLWSYLDSQTVFTIILIKFHIRGKTLGSVHATIWSRILVCLSDWVKKTGNAPQIRKTFSLLECEKWFAA